MVVLSEGAPKTPARTARGSIKHGSSIADSDWACDLLLTA